MEIIHFIFNFKLLKPSFLYLNIFAKLLIFEIKKENSIILIYFTFVFPIFFILDKIPFILVN